MNLAHSRHFRIIYWMRMCDHLRPWRENKPPQITLLVWVLASSSWELAKTPDSEKSPNRNAKVTSTEFQELLKVCSPFCLLNSWRLIALVSFSEVLILWISEAYTHLLTYCCFDQAFIFSELCYLITRGYRGATGKPGQWRRFTVRNLKPFSRLKYFFFF